MSKPLAHTRIIEIPDAQSLQGGHLESIQVEHHGRRMNLVMDLQGFTLTSQPCIWLDDGVVREKTEGTYHPRRLRFTGLQELSMTGLFVTLDALPITHEARTIRDMFAWQPIGKKLNFFTLLHGGPGDSDLYFYANRVIDEPRPGKSKPVAFTRDWSSAPVLPARLVPDMKSIYRTFGGDPISLTWNGRVHKRRLFIGGLDKQSDIRPNVDSVLNLGEKSSRWLALNQPDSRDRWVDMGEGQDGMDIETITAEAMWVIEKLLAGQRVLVHCVAGMNRSSTICCAVLILLERLSAEAALERVREHHPWARPDSHHWLRLRWLASTITT